MAISIGKRQISYKFIVAMTSILAATGLKSFSLLETAGYVTIVVTALGIYTTANVAQKALTPKPNVDTTGTATN